MYKVHVAINDVSSVLKRLKSLLKIVNVFAVRTA